MPNTLLIEKFQDPVVTVKGETRATVSYTKTKTLWFNTGTLCNIECINCYIESSPTNDRLVYLSVADVVPFLDELDEAGEQNIEIGFTGGEAGVMRIQGLGYFDPDIIAYYGVNATGAKAMTGSGERETMIERGIVGADETQPTIVDTGRMNARAEKEEARMVCQEDTGTSTGGRMETTIEMEAVKDLEKHPP